MTKNTTEYNAAKKIAKDAAKAAYMEDKHIPLDILNNRSFSYKVEYKDENNNTQTDEYTAYVAATSLLTKEQRQGFNALANRMRDYIAASVAERTLVNAPKVNRNTAKECLQNLAKCLGYNMTVDNKDIETLYNWGVGKANNGNMTDSKITNAAANAERLIANKLANYNARIMLNKDTEYKAPEKKTIEKTIKKKVTEKAA